MSLCMHVLCVVCDWCMCLCMYTCMHASVGVVLWCILWSVCCVILWFGVLCCVVSQYNKYVIHHDITVLTCTQNLTTFLYFEF